MLSLKPARVLLAVMLTVVVGLLSVPASASTPAQHDTASSSWPCHKTDKFKGGFFRLRHVLRCRHIPYKVVKSGPPPTTIPSAPGASGIEHPDGGGPPCTWIQYHYTKVCYPYTDHPGFLCFKWGGTAWEYGYHCKASDAYTYRNAMSAWGWIKYEAGQVGGLFNPHELKACAEGAISPVTAASTGTIAGVLIKVSRAAPGPAGVIGIIAGLAGGCVGGIVNYHWGKP